MRQYVRGDRIEVLKKNGTLLEESCHPAQIVGGNGDVYTVLYDRHANGVVEERVSMRCIRPRPPLVEFSDWSHGDLVQVFDSFAWQSAAVLRVSEEKLFRVRVLGSAQDQIVGAAWIRVRHQWQDDQWIVVGKGPSISNEKRLFIAGIMISELLAKQRNASAQDARRSTHQKSHNAPTKAVKRNLLSSTPDQNQTDALRGAWKISRTGERSSPGTLNRTEACTGTGIIGSRVTEKHQGMSRPSATNAVPREAQQGDSGLSSVDSCSIKNNRSSGHYPTKLAQHLCRDDISDAESCTGPSRREALPDRSAQRCGLVLRFRLRDTLLPGAALNKKLPRSKACI